MLQPTRLGYILVPAGLLLLGVPAIWMYMRIAAPVLHPNPQEVPSVTQAAPSPAVAAAVNSARQMVRAHISEENLPGLSVAVGIGGDLAWAEGFGYADIKSSTLVTPAHRFRIGTASPVLTSAAVGLLLQDGHLKLDEQIQTYVPAFPRKQWPVTLRQLMSHTAGIMPDGGDGSPLFEKQCKQATEALPRFANRPLVFQPGTQYRESPYDWILVSAAIEAAANQPFPAFMQERVFQPLGMHDTIADSAAIERDYDHPLFNLIRERIIDPRALGKTFIDPANRPVQQGVTYYFPRFASDPNYGMHLMRPLDFSCYAGSSAFLSTPSDLVRFGIAVNTGKLLQPGTVQLLQTSQRLTSGDQTGYGLGWAVETVTLAGQQTRAAGHNGELLGGAAASLVTLPDREIVVSVTSNISYANPHSVAMRIAEAFLEQAPSAAASK